MQLRNKRIIPAHRYRKAGSTIDITDSLAGQMEESKVDTMREIRSVFEEHNREVYLKSKGHVIQIPHFTLAQEE